MLIWGIIHIYMSPSCAVDVEVSCCVKLRGRCMEVVRWGRTLQEKGCTRQGCGKQEEVDP